MTRPLLAAALLVTSSAAARAQISLASVVDLALKDSPKVKMAVDDVNKTTAVLDESKDVFIPALSVGGGYGDSFGYSNNLPTLFTFSAQSLVYNSSQFDYIRAARSGLGASKLALAEARQAVIEDVALTYASLQHDQDREAVLHEENARAQRLASIVQDRFDAGRDTRLELHTARLTAAQINLRVLSAADETSADQMHLASLIGLPAAILHTDDAFPAVPRFSNMDAGQTPGIAAAFATAKSKQEQAWGDRRYLYRPQASLVVQYNRYATFTDSFKQIEQTYGNSIGANEEVFGLEFTLPLFDRGKLAKARESAADASHALHDAQNLQLQSNEARARLRHSLAILEARQEVANEEQAVAQDQLDVIEALLAAPAASNAQQMTPKDEQNSRIAEREKYLGVVDSQYQIRKAQIQLLRLTGGLEQWVKSPVSTPAPRATVQP